MGGISGPSWYSLQLDKMCTSYNQEVFSKDLTLEYNQAVKITGFGIQLKDILESGSTRIKDV